ncbi:unnamed protein product [Ambrosiozyma monospora]|uniref:Unnamed protein product n=1 Tax=Ambrosiozyma monospora TaxID=43982 RepID=A0ACB5UDF9_AMBMO|nr:unnamed protein product [Ambrosiozyma monospora]
MVNAGAIPTRSTSVNIPSDSEYQSTLNSCYNNHVSYWNSKSSSTNYEHWRYKDGFQCAWSDETTFMKFNNSRIGRVNAWMCAREVEHINKKGNSDFIWEWEAGFNEALKYLKSK